MGFLYGIVFVTFLLALSAYMRAWRAFRGTVATYLRVHGGWISTLDMWSIFGGDVYVTIRQLEAEGFVERRTEPGGPERGGRERALYRWKV